VYILPEDGHRSGPKHVVVVHNKIEHEKHLLRTVVLIKVLMLRYVMLYGCHNFIPKEHSPLTVCEAVLCCFRTSFSNLCLKWPVIWHFTLNHAHELQIVSTGHIRYLSLSTDILPSLRKRT
jgi:hypothetical protein